jgi:hypothetical protein
MPKTVKRLNAGCDYLHASRQNIVTYSGFSIHDGTLLHSKSQYTCTSPDDQMSSSSTVLTRVLLSRNLPIRTQSSNQKESAAKYTCLHPTDLQIRLSYVSRSSKTPNPVSVEMPIYCCQRNTAACLNCYPPITPKPSSIVVYLRKPHICNNIVTEQQLSDLHTLDEVTRIDVKNTVFLAETLTPNFYWK